jgi:hypothetical protein
MTTERAPHSRPPPIGIGSCKALGAAAECTIPASPANHRVEKIDDFFSHHDVFLQVGLLIFDPSSGTALAGTRLPRAVVVPATAMSVKPVIGGASLRPR